MNAARPVVFVDADDTLWENNRWFTGVIDDWARFVAEQGAAPDIAVTILHEEEDRHIPLHGYGAVPFCHSLRTAFARMVPQATPDVAAAFAEFVASAEERIRHHPIHLLRGVREGLEALAPHARLVVLTKGQHDEQEAKVARSGLAPLFESVRVVPEKDPICYLAAANAVEQKPHACWMVGNSPRSDINPARRAGMRTVLVPHAAPWHRDLAPLIEEGPETLMAASFADVPRLVRGERRD